MCCGDVSIEKGTERLAFTIYTRLVPLSSFPFVALGFFSPVLFGSALAYVGTVGKVNLPLAFNYLKSNLVPQK